MLSANQNLALVIARIMFVAIFCLQDAIYNKLIYFDRSINYITSFHLPFPYLLLSLTVTLELLSSTMIIMGWKAKWGAALLLVFTGFATIIFHRFWTYQDPSEFQNQLNHFMKNISIMGGAIFIIIFDVGDYVLKKF